MNNFDNFFKDMLKDGPLLLYIPKEGVTVEPPKGVTAIDKTSGAFIAGDKYMDEYKDTCRIMQSVKKPIVAKTSSSEAEEQVRAHDCTK
jgi:hypothetical protein